MMILLSPLSSLSCSKKVTIHTFYEMAKSSSRVPGQTALQEIWVYYLGVQKIVKEVSQIMEAYGNKRQLGNSEGNMEMIAAVASTLVLQQFHKVLFSGTSLVYVDVVFIRLQEAKSSQFHLPQYKIHTPPFTATSYTHPSLSS